MSQRMATWTPPGRCQMPLGSMTLSERWSQFTARHSGIAGVGGPSTLTLPVQKLAGPSLATVTRGGPSACATDEIVVRPRAARAIVKSANTPRRIGPPQVTDRRLYGLGMRVSSSYLGTSCLHRTAVHRLSHPSPLAAPTFGPRDMPTRYLLPYPATGRIYAYIDLYSRQLIREHPLSSGRRPAPTDAAGSLDGPARQRSVIYRPPGARRDSASRRARRS